MSWFGLFIGVVFLLPILVAQRITTPARRRLALGAPFLLAVIGLVTLLGHAGLHHVPASTVWVALGGLVVGGALLGALRGLTVRLTVEQGLVLTRASWLTMVLWLVSVALHITTDWGAAFRPGPAALSSATFPLWLAVTWGSQRAVVYRRGARQRAALGPIDATATDTTATVFNWSLRFTPEGPRPTRSPGPGPGGAISTSSEVLPPAEPD
jgi:hypothetical protein